LELINSKTIVYFQEKVFYLITKPLLNKTKKIDMKELQPLQEYVLLELLEMEEKTSGGIIIPDTAKEKPQYGKVIALGNIENPGIAAGDFVYFKKYAGTEVEYKGRDLLFVPYADLLAKIVDTESI